MSISPLHRSLYPTATWSTSNNTPVSPPVESVESTPELQPLNDLLQTFLSDSFDSGGLEQLSKVLGEFTKLMDSLGGTQPRQGNQGNLYEDSFEEPLDLASPGGPSGTPPANSPEKPTHPTYASDAGPGFGPPSAGSTEPVNPSEPWLAKNNVGSPYNSNMQLIDPGQKDQFKYTNTFVNNTNQPQTVTLWNKTGEDGGPNSGQYFDKSTPVTFTLQPGQSQTVAFDSNSSVAWCVSKDGTANPGANSGQTWGEATFANSGTGWSGYDVSQIEPAGHNGRMSISNDATGKTVTEANAWQTPSDDPAGLDVGVPAGPLSLTTTFS